MQLNTIQREGDGLNLEGMTGADYHIFSALISGVHMDPDIGFGVVETPPAPTVATTGPATVAPTAPAVDFAAHTARTIPNLRYWKTHGSVTARIAFVDSDKEITAGLEFTVRDKSGNAPSGIDESKLWWIWHAHFRIKKNIVEVISTHFKTGHKKTDSQNFDDLATDAKPLIEHLLSKLKPFDRGTKGPI